MSEDHNEGGDLIVVFHIFLFTACVAFSNQVGRKLGLKLPLLLLYLVGMLVGFYYVNYPKEKILVLGYLGRAVLRTAYTPVYFFTGVFDLESEFIHARGIPHAVACFLVWISTTVSVSFVSVTMLDGSFDWYPCLAVALIVTIPDLKATKRFMEASHSFSSKKIFILLEMECLVGSIFTSIAHDLFIMNQRNPTGFQLLTFLMRNVFTCIFAFLVGKFTSASINRMHFDHTNQITTIFVAIFFTYAASAAIESSGDLAVLTFGLVLLSAKPSMTPETVNNINRFIETFRHALVGSILVIGGILFTISVNTISAKKFLSLNIVIYLIVVVCRFFIIGGFWVVFREFYQLKIMAIFTICTFNIKGIFNIILALSFITHIRNFDPEINELFTLANVQIFLSIVITNPIASYAFSAEGQQTANIQTIEMVQKALSRINECKAMTIKVLKGIQFTVDADWSKVLHSTSIEKGFFKRFAYRVNVKEVDPCTYTIDEPQIRMDAVRDLLRLQKRFLEEQFRHGILAGPSAKQFAYFMRSCMHKAKFMSTQIVIDSTAPYSVMQIIIQDLLYALNTQRRDKCWVAVVTITFFFDVTFNTFTVFSKMFMYSHINKYIPTVYMAYCFLLGVFGILSILQTGTHYLHTVSYSLWNWLAWAFTFLSFATFCLDMFVLEVELSLDYSYRLQSLSIGMNLKVYYFLTMLKAFMVLSRSLIVACTLYPMQSVLFRITSSMLHSHIFKQCDVCQGFLQAMIDTHQRLESRSLDKNLESGAADILHLQSLAMRQFIGVMEFLTPDVMTALKTRLACRLVLMSQERMIHELDEAGEVEDKELGLLTQMLRTKLQDIYTIKKTLTEPSYLDIVKNIPWVAMAKLRGEEILDFGEITTFRPGDVLLTQGKRVNGLIVILRGLVRVEIASKRKNETGENVSKYRKSRYIIKGNQKKLENAERVELLDFYTRGNVIGEYPFLIDKPAHKTYRCVTTVKALCLSNELIDELMESTLDLSGPMNPLEHSMWTTVAIRQAARLVQWCASYHLLTRRQLYGMLENSFMMDSIVCNLLEREDLKRSVIILIYGELSCPTTGGHYVGPTIIPSNLINLHLKRPNTIQLIMGPSRNVILVLRAFKSARMSVTRKPVVETPTADLESLTSVSMLTVSSGSSDGIPYRHPYN